MPTKPELWTVEELVRAKEKSTSSAKHLELPRFQRSLEWTEAQKKDLVAALIKGYPIGAPILYDDQEATKRNGKPTYLVVDGLQRISALAWYQSAQLERFSLGAIDANELDSFRSVVVQNSRLPELEATDVDDQVREWLGAVKVVSPEFDASALIDHLESSLKCTVNPDLKQACRSIVDTIRKLVQIDGRLLPVLVYQGD